MQKHENQCLKTAELLFPDYGYNGTNQMRGEYEPIA